MFQPACFRENRIEVMQKMMREQPFASVISLQEGEIVGDHLPLVLHSDSSEYGVLQGHINRANPICKKWDADTELLVIFQGAHHYVSASWYPSKQDHGKAVPTWNYIMVHARGRLRLHEDGAWLLNHLNELTQQQEHGRPMPWKVADAPAEYIERMTRGIIGVEIEITSLQGTWKASQNKDERDRGGVVRGLRQEGSDHSGVMADLVEQRLG